MRDTLNLQRRFAFEILVVPILACGKHPPPPAPPDATPIATADAEPISVPISEPIPKPSTHPFETRRPPTCPSGTWCTTPRNAAKVAKGGLTEMGCAASIAWWDDVDGGARASDLPARFAQGSLDVPATIDARKARAADECCYSWVSPCPGGRPLRDESGVLTAAVGDGAGWCADVPASPSDLAAETRRTLAGAWLADALAEHASVASFARASLELIAVGAPAELVAACQRASLDEIEHARMCFAQAARFAEQSVGPAPLVAPACRTPTLEQIAIDTFVEGCVGETIAALAAERARAGCSDASSREVLARIADDEAAHAALAWRTVTWAVRAAPRRVLRALEAAARGIRPKGRDAHVDAAGDPTLARFGRLTLAEQDRVVADAWREVIDPTLERLSRRPRAHAGAATGLVVGLQAIRGGRRSACRRRARRRLRSFRCRPT